MIHAMLEEKIWAVVGASDNPTRFGYKIYQTLKQHGYTVYAVNPGLEKIAEDPVYKDLQSLPGKPAVVNMVVNAKAALKVLEEMKELDIKNVWFQPGADAKAVVQKAQELGLTIVEDCVLVALRK